MPEQVIQREDRAAIFLSRASQTAHDSPNGQVFGRLPSIPLPPVDLDPTAQCPGVGIAARAGVLRKWEACLRPEASDSAIMMATTEPPWLVTPEKVHAVVGRLIEMAHPKQIILFGSYARGKITENSDLDVLIVAGDEVENTRRESVRLRGALKEIEMPIDIVVVRESTFQKLSDTPGLIYEEARRTGLLVYECESSAGSPHSWLAHAKSDLRITQILPLRQWCRDPRSLEVPRPS